MQQLGVRWTMRSMMAATAVAAVVSSAVFGQDAGSAGVAIVGTCIFVLACKRTTEFMELREQHDLTMDRREKARFFLSSSAVAAAIVLPSDLAFITGYHIWLYFPRFATGPPQISPGDIVSSAVFGTGMALVMASGLRRALWPLGLTASERLRRFFGWKPGVVVACISILVSMMLMINSSHFHLF